MGSRRSGDADRTDCVTIKENQKGVSFETLFAPYFKGAKRIDIVDPYIRMFHQCRNLMELIEVVIRNKAPEEEVTVRLQTIEDEERGDQQRDLLQSIQDNASIAGVDFDWEFDKTRTIHDRKIETDTGWKITLGRGLDMFQQFDHRDAFSLGHRLQDQRRCKACEIGFFRP